LAFSSSLLGGLNRRQSFVEISNIYSGAADEWARCAYCCDGRLSKSAAGGVTTMHIALVFGLLANFWKGAKPRR
jgi:hypothetical protein